MYSEMFVDVDMKIKTGRSMLWNSFFLSTAHPTQESADPIDHANAVAPEHKIKYLRWYLSVVGLVGISVSTNNFILKLYIYI